MPHHDNIKIVKIEQESINWMTNQVVTELITKVSYKFFERFEIFANPNVLPHIFITDKINGSRYMGMHVDEILKRINIDLRKEKIEDLL